jgi:predicted RNase H-like HicB family nuclease/post-segregation antitoxin (ccd killing protein)
VLTKIPEGYAAYCPDIVFDTFGKDLAGAIEQARDALGLMGIDMEDDGKSFPEPTPIESVARDDDEIVTFVDADLTEYRKAYERRTVRRNVTLPSWLDFEAEKSGINVSAVLQEALKAKLGVDA